MLIALFCGIGLPALIGIGLFPGFKAWLVDSRASYALADAETAPSPLAKVTEVPEAHASQVMEGPASPAVGSGQSTESFTPLPQASATKPAQPAKPSLASLGPELKKVDVNVATTAYRVAKDEQVSDKIMLALFEAALVESNCQNLGHLGAANDHDSLGYLQQRPSQGWKNPMDVSTATRSFIDKARAVLARNPGLSAGNLAQAVQVSAYPDRYRKRQAAAEKLIRWLQ